MRVAIVSETFLPATDGIVTRLLYAIDALVLQGHEVLVICPEMGEEVEIENVKIIKTPSKTFSFYPSRPWGLPSSKVTKALIDFEPDIIHAVAPTSLCLPAVRHARKNNIPLLTSYHTHLPKYMDHYWYFKPFRPTLWAYLRKMHNISPICLVTSNSMKHELSEQGIKNIEVLPRGLDQEGRNPKFRSETMRKRLTDGEVDKKLLVYIGRLAREKDINTLLPLVKAHPEYRYAIVGDGPEREELEKLFAGTPTVFTGFLHGEEVSQAFASGDVFLFPSRSETLGLVILEAMSSGVPIVAAASDPIEEQIDNKFNGLLYDGDSYKEELSAAPSNTALIEAVENLLENDSLYECIRKNALETAASQSWENASQALIDYYYKTIEIYENKVNKDKKINDFEYLRTETSDHESFQENDNESKKSEEKISASYTINNK